MTYAWKDNPSAARELFEASIALKRETGDLLGIAVTYGNLGRLHLRWGLLEQAERCFREDLALSERVGDRRGSAVMANWLGKIALERGDWPAAVDLLARSVEAGRELGETVIEAFAAQDLAVGYVMLGDLGRADESIQRASEVFENVRQPEGLAHVERARGLLLAARGELEVAEASLRRAHRFFVAASQWHDAARIQLEIGEVLRRAAKPTDAIVRELTEALESAERSRRDYLVKQIEAELRSVRADALYLHRYRRTRGKAFDDDDLSLTTGLREVITVLYLDVKGSTESGLTTDPEIVMRDFNQMMATFVGPLERHEARISGYRGDGFLALFRGEAHARRAVESALDIFAVLDQDFNVPREVLGMRPFRLRVGIHSGEAFLGNVGTPHKMEFTALGTTANFGARVEANGQVGMPCISSDTHALVGAHYEFAPGNPRIVQAKGFPEGAPVWDVAGRRRS